MADLLIPLFVIIIMFMLIDAIDTMMPLMFLSASFLPISWIFIRQINDGAYTLLFGASIDDYVGIGFLKVLGTIMLFVPAVGFVKTMYLHSFIHKGDIEEDENE